MLQFLVYQMVFLLNQLILCFQKDTVVRLAQHLDLPKYPHNFVLYWYWGAARDIALVCFPALLRHPAVAMLSRRLKYCQNLGGGGGGANGNGRKVLEIAKAV